MQLVSNAYSRQLLEIQKHNAFYYCWDIQSILKFNVFFSLYWNLELNETRLPREGRERVKKGNNPSARGYRHMNLYVHVCLYMLTHGHTVCIHTCLCVHTYRHMHLCVYRCVYVCSSMSMYFVYIRVCMCLYIRVGCVHSCVYIHSLKCQSCFRSATQAALLMLIEILVLMWVFWCTNQELWGPASPFRSELGC